MNSGYAYSSTCDTGTGGSSSFFPGPPSFVLEMAADRSRCAGEPSVLPQCKCSRRSVEVIDSRIHAMDLIAI